MLDKPWSSIVGFSFFLRLFLCILILGLHLYYYVDQQNELMELRLNIPPLSKELRALEEENLRLEYQVEQFESPVHLIELAQKPEFSHLKHPLQKDILVIEGKNK